MSTHLHKHCFDNVSVQAAFYDLRVTLLMAATRRKPWAGVNVGIDDDVRTPRASQHMQPRNVMLAAPGAGGAVLAAAPVARGGAGEAVVAAAPDVHGGEGGAADAAPVNEGDDGMDGGICATAGGREAFEAKDRCWAGRGA